MEKESVDDCTWHAVMDQPGNGALHSNSVDQNSDTCNTQLLGRLNIDPMWAQEEEARTSWLYQSEANLPVIGG